MTWASVSSHVYSKECPSLGNELYSVGLADLPRCCICSIPHGKVHPARPSWPNTRKDFLTKPLTSGQDSVDRWYTPCHRRYAFIAFIHLAELNDLIFRDVVKEYFAQCQELDKGIFQVPPKLYFNLFMKTWRFGRSQCIT